MSLELHQSDALTYCQSLPDASVHTIITDPPYWTLEKWRSVGTTTRLSGGNPDYQTDAQKAAGNGWFSVISPEDLYALLCEFSRLLPKNGHAWLCADGETASYIQGYVRDGETGFGYVKSYPLLKLRSDGQGFRSGMGYHGRASHEHLVLCEKGRRAFPDANFADVFFAPWIGDSETRLCTPDGKPYPTAKPLSLGRRLVELSSLPGETVLDPFCGGGFAVAAAHQSGRNAIGVDIREYALSTTRRRAESAAASALPRVSMHQLPIHRNDCLSLWFG